LATLKSLNPQLERGKQWNLIYPGDIVNLSAAPAPVAPTTAPGTAPGTAPVTAPVTAPGTAELKAAERALETAKANYAAGKVPKSDVDAAQRLVEYYKKQAGTPATTTLGTKTEPVGTEAEPSSPPPTSAPASSPGVPFTEVLPPGLKPVKEKYYRWGGGVIAAKDIRATPMVTSFGEVLQFSTPWTYLTGIKSWEQLEPYAYYETTYVTDPEWLKLPETERARQMAEFNAKIAGR